MPLKPAPANIDCFVTSIAKLNKRRNISNTTFRYKKTSPDISGDVELMGTLFIWFFNPNIFEA